MLWFTKVYSVNLGRVSSRTKDSILVVCIAVQRGLGKERNWGKEGSVEGGVDSGRKRKGATQATNCNVLSRNHEQSK
jgi:hypothetical protein